MSWIYYVLEAEEPDVLDVSWSVFADQFPKNSLESIITLRKILFFSCI